MAGVTLPPNDFYAFRPATVKCVIEAANKQAVPANLLLALASIEGGKNGQEVLNTNADNTGPAKRATERRSFRRGADDNRNSADAENAFTVRFSRFF